ncbi:metal ABC transporter substrate-binding protein [Ruminococcus sp.]|uniref:metal ABC transporter substrate-binding protein n=1 Tax=Ruminococcus sp. TaxID=41978 RepID=UPI0025E90259|nr:metal ABC transporter substrate-binding protein [Ruminococcus sp.]MCR4639443.1 metal ABC transporter substrate-binding protein [Ruminococcus sp.]
MFRIGRFLSLAAAAVLAVSVSTGCANSASSKKNGKISIVCTTFSEYDWTRNIIGDTDSAEVTYLLGSGVDLHNYQPTAQDILTISSCDLLMYVGGESESWVTDALKDTKNKDMKVLRLFDVLGQSIKEEELKEGMEPEEEEDEGEEGPEYDEHVWLSVKNAEVICEAICSSICEKDAENADKYRANLESYKAELKKLDDSFTEMADNAKTKTILFGDRFPFRYLVDDYGIDYYAAFAGCSAETAASFETIAKLAEKVNELSLDTVFIIENSDDSIAKSIIANSKNKDVNIEKLNSLQSITMKDINNGATYISLMEQNLETLERVLD